MFDLPQGWSGLWRYLTRCQSPFDPLEGERKSSSPVEKAAGSLSLPKGTLGKRWFQDYATRAGKVLSTDCLQLAQTAGLSTGKVSTASICNVCCACSISSQTPKRT